MADWDAIFAERDDFKALRLSIDEGTDEQWREEVRKLREAHGSDIDLAPALTHCIERGQLDTLEKLLNDGAEISNRVVECSARCQDTAFLFTLLDYGWPINDRLQRGVLPPVLS